MLSAITGVATNTTDNKATRTIQQRLTNDPPLDARQISFELI